MPRLLSEIESGEKLRGRLLVPTYETVPTGTYRHVMDYHVRKAASLATGIVTYSGRWSHELQCNGNHRTHTQVQIRNDRIETSLYLEQKDPDQILVVNQDFIERIMKGEFLSDQLSESDHLIDNTQHAREGYRYRIVQYNKKDFESGKTFCYERTFLTFKLDEFGYQVPKIENPLGIKEIHFRAMLSKSEVPEEGPDYSRAIELFSELDKIMEEARKLISSEQE